MNIDGLEYHRPRKLEEAHDLLKRFGEKAAILAGGTDLVISLRQGEKRPAAIIDISGIAELKRLEVTADGLHIGSMVTFAELSSSAEAGERAPALAAAVSEIGSPQIRNAGTIGGNIATASPAGDSLPALVAHEALVALSSKAGERVLPVRQFLEERNGRAIAGELIREVIIPVSPGSVTGSFAKLGRRDALAIARLNAAVVIKRNPAGMVEKASLVLGTLGKAPVSVPKAEAIISGGTLTGDERDRIAQCASDAVRDSIPGRPTMEYKARAVKGVVHLALEKISHG